jgi:hypothetical protein
MRGELVTGDEYIGRFRTTDQQPVDQGQDVLQARAGAVTARVVHGWIAALDDRGDAGARHRPAAQDG